MASSLPVRCARLCSAVARPGGALIPRVANKNSVRISHSVFAHPNITSSSPGYCSRASQEVHIRAIVEQTNDSVSLAERGSTEPFNTWKIKMLYDGECPLCMREVNMLQERNKLYGTIKFVDISSNDYSPKENAGLDYKTVRVAYMLFYMMVLCSQTLRPLKGYMKKLGLDGCMPSQNTNLLQSWLMPYTLFGPNIAYKLQDVLLWIR